MVLDALIKCKECLIVIFIKVSVTEEEMSRQPPVTDLPYRLHLVGQILQLLHLAHSRSHEHDVPQAGLGRDAGGHQRTAPGIITQGTALAHARKAPIAETPVFPGYHISK